MGEPSAEAFADWLQLSDVVEHYYQAGEREPDALVVAMLGDGQLRAAAGKLVVDGRDRGLAMIPPGIWDMAARTDVWVTGRFRLHRAKGERSVTISAYDVRVDPEIQALPTGRAERPAAPPPTPPPPTGKRPGRPSGTHGEPIARVVKRLLSLPESELRGYKVEALTSDLQAEYRALGLSPPHEDNARREARGILHALRERG